MPFEPKIPTQTKQKAPRKTKEKTEPLPAPVAAPEPQTAAIVPSDSSATPAAPLFNAAPDTSPTSSPISVNHGLTFPDFNPNTYFANDLFTDSSTLTRTTKADADARIQSIEEKRQTLRVAEANQGLNQDTIRAGIQQRKIEGLAIDYATAGVNNQTKYVQYQIADVRRQTMETRLEQSREQYTQEGKVLTGMRSITALIDEEWAARKALKVSRINDFKQSALRASASINEQAAQLSGEFRQELNALPSA